MREFKRAIMVKKRVFVSAEEAAGAVETRKERVFRCTCMSTGDVVWVVERNYHYARSQATRHWKLLTATLEQRSYERMVERVQTMGEADRERLRQLLRAKPH